MGKRRVNKSAKVREYLVRHPDHPPRKVAQELKPLHVTTQYISSIKLQMKKEGLFPDAPRPYVSPSVSLAEIEAPGSEIEEGVVDLQVILTAARLIRRCGTLQEAHRALEQAERLVSALKS